MTDDEVEQALREDTLGTIKIHVLPESYVLVIRESGGSIALLEEAQTLEAVHRLVSWHAGRLRPLAVDGSDLH